MTSSRIPGLRDEACPACNRLIGTHLTCPYCDQDSQQRPLLRRLYLAAFTMSLTGLATLLLLAERAQPPVISMTAIRPAMNHGYVTLAGPEDATGHLYLVAGKPPRLYPDGSHQGRSP